MEVFHNMEKNNSISMSERRLALFELLQNHTIRIGYRLASFTLPIPDRDSISLAWRFHEIRDVRR
jgi:hypothetical protein